MVEKIIVSPSDVRGLGDIVSPKSASDFVLSDAEISSATESVNNMNLTVYHLQMSSLGILAVGVSPSSVTVGGGVTVTATVTDRLGEPLEDVPVVISCGSYSFDATDTDSNGQVVKSYTTASGDVGSMVVTAASEGYTTATSYVSVNKHVSDLSMSIAESSIVIGESFALSGVLKIDNVGTSGLKIKIYQDDVCIDDDVTTGTSGAWSKSVTGSTAGTTKFKAVYEGSNINASDETTEYTCTVGKKSTSLNIEVPTIHYTDAFNVVGTLMTGTGANATPISGASVVLHWKVNGGTEQTSLPQTTGSDGKVTFGRSAPTSIETYKFWLTYAGDDTYVECTSSNPTVDYTVEKESTTIALTSPLNGAQYDSGDSVTVSGTLKTDDNEVLTVQSPSVVIMEGYTLIDTANVSTVDGTFSKTITGLSDGLHSLSVSYAGDTYYQGDSETRSITILADATVSTVTLASDKSILSYADSETATLTATALTSQNVGVPDQLVMFYSGTPDIVDDCTSGTALSTITGSPTFDSNGMTIHNGDKVTYNPSQFVMDLTTKSYKIYATCTKPTGGDYLGLVIVDSYGDPHYKTAVFIGDSTIDFLDSTVSTPSGLGSTINVCVELTPTSQKLYIDGSLVTTKSIDYSESASGFDEYIYLGFWDNLEFTVTNLVVFEDNSSAFVAYDVTDSNGVASVTYQSKGTGDVSFTAKCGSILSEIYEIQDLYLYDECTSEIHTWNKLGTNCSYSFSSNGLYVKGTSGGTYLKLDETLPSTYSVEAEIKLLETGANLKGSTFTCENTFIQASNSNTILIATMNGAEQTLSNTYSVGDTIKIEYDGTNVKYYKNGSLLGTTGKGSGTYTGFLIRNVMETGITIKDLKIKPL